MTVTTVSTRAPVKGATDGTIKQPKNKCGSFNSRSREGSDIFNAIETAFDYAVSTRAPVKGATPQQAILELGLHCFNSRSREGSD